MIALHNFLLSNNFIHPANDHTKPSGIWRKLQTLYDLEALDEREDARQLSDLSIEDGDEEGADDTATDVYSEAANKIHREDFSLPEDDDAVREMAWKRRFPKADEDAEEESEAELPELNLAKEAPVRFIPTISVEPSEAATPSGRKGSRQKGSAPAKKAAPGTTRRSRRQVEEQPPEEEAEASEEGADEEDEKSEDEDAEESEASSAPARSTRTGRGRGRGAARGGRGRARGRGR